MKKLFSLLTVLAIALFPVNSYAWSPPASPKPASAILDQAGALSDSAHNRLDSQLKQINANSANEIAVLILPTLDGEDISDVGIATAKAWGVGKKDLDNGVLIILAMKEHKSRIETGKGVEGDLPDLKCNDILANVLRPHMKKGDVEGGLSATINVVSSTIANHKSEVTNGGKHPVSCQVSNPGSTSSDTIWLGIIALLGLAGAIAVRLFIRKKEREIKEEFEREEKAAREEQERRTQEDFAMQNKMIAEKKRHEREAAKSLQEALEALTPVVPVPIIPRSVMVKPVKEVKHSTHAKPATVKTSHVKPTVVATASTITLATLEAERHARKASERQERLRKEDTDRRAEESRRKRQEEDDDRRRRDYESSSNSSFDWGGSSGGDFGGGDFGGGGSSSDW